MTFLKVLLTPGPLEENEFSLQEEFKVVTFIVIVRFRFVMGLFPFLMEQDSCKALTNKKGQVFFGTHQKWVFFLNFRLSENTTKNGKKNPTSFDVTEEMSKKVGDFSQTLWPSHNILTLTAGI